MRRHARSLIFALVTTLVAGGVAGGWILTLRQVPVLPGMKGCRTLSDRDERSDCLAHRFIKEVRGPARVAPALRELQRLAATDGRIAESCHDAGHTSAPKVFDAQRARQQLVAAVNVRGDCADGFFHGSMIEALSGGAGETLDTLARLCGSAQMAESRLRHSCVHAIGHGLVAGAELEPAIASCSSHYGPRNELRGQCYSGVYMQHGMDRTDQMRRTGDVAGHCVDAPNKDASFQCYSYVASNGTNIGWPSERSAAVCRTTPTRDTRTWCLRGVGTGRLRDGADFCLEQRDPTDGGACMDGFFSRNLVSFEEISPPQAVDLCESARGTAAAACAEGLGGAWSSPLWPEPGDQSCRTHFRGELRDSCLRGYRAFRPQLAIETEVRPSR